VKSSRLQKLKALESGDVIFGIDAGGRGKVLLVIEASKSNFVARHVTSQATVRFGRDGHSKKIKGGGSCTIVSTRPLPAKEYGIVLGLDRKCRLGQFPDGHMLNQDEINLILKLDDYFKARPLVDEESMDLPDGAVPASLD
jgi:hypothetical protein